MIEGGSHTPGVDPALFRLPNATAMRIDLPAVPLRPFVTTYHVYDSEPLTRDGASNWAAPQGAAIRFVLAPRQYEVTIGPRRYAPVPRAALFGVTSRAIHIVSYGGVTIGIDLTALGWARFIAAPADSLRDRVTPLAEVYDPAAADALHAALAASDRDTEVKRILDDFFLPRIGQPTRDDPAIAALAALLHVEDVATLDEACAATGLTPRQLRRVALRYFGLPPKSLLLRARLIRPMRQMIVDKAESDLEYIPASYFDRSHFLRDARRFLDTTPRRFMRRDMEFVRAVMRATSAVFEADRANAAAVPPATDR